MATIGFIGASGLMGHGMAKNLLAKGHALALTVHRNRERVADLLAAGAAEQAIAGGAGARQRHRLPLRHRLAAGRGRDRRARTACSPARSAAASSIVDCSTSEPDSTARLRERLRRGRRRPRRRAAGAHAGRGRGRQAQRHGRRRRRRSSRSSSRCCACFAENVFHVGGPGAGHIIKLLNNFIAQAICTATAEAFAVGAARRHRPAASWSRWSRSARELGPVPDDVEDARRRDGRADASSSTTRARTSATTPTSPKAWRSRRVVGEAVHQSLALASALGHGKKFVPSLVEAQEQLTGATIVPRRA